MTLVDSPTVLVDDGAFKVDGSATRPMSAPTGRWRFDVVDLRLQQVGELYPEPGCTISFDTAAAVKRTLSGLTLIGPQAAEVDYTQDRVRPVWVDGEGTETSAGVFVWHAGTLTTSRGSPSRLEGGVLWDETQSMWGQLPVTFQGSDIEVKSDPSDPTTDLDVVPTGNLALALEELLSLFTRLDLSRVVFPSGGPSSGRKAWPAGMRVTQVMERICKMAGWVWYFDRDGDLQVRSAPDVVAGAADVAYNDGDIDRDTLTDSRDIGVRPNRWKLDATGFDDEPVQAEFQLPPDHPGSAARLGYEVVRVIEESQIDPDRAQRTVVQAARDDWRAEREVEFVTSPRPDHPEFAVVDLFGDRLVERSWELTVVPGGGVHVHRCRAVTDFGRF